MSSAEMIKAIQVRRRQVAGLIEDDAWRDFLARETGKRSLREMSPAELARVLDALVKLGAPKRSFSRPSPKAWSRKVFVLWRSLGLLGVLDDPGRPALRAFVKRQVGRDDPDFLGADEAASCIEALKSWLGREGAPPPTKEVEELIVLWRTRASLPPAGPGFAAKCILIEALWKKLGEAGAFRHTPHVGTWLSRFGVSSPEFLSDEAADKAISQLGDWLKRTRAKAAGGPQS